MGFFERVKSTVLHWIYPRRCAFCSAVISPKETICPDCVKNLAWVEAPICKTCGRGLPYCKCRKRYQFRRCVAPFYYEGRAKSAVLRLKFYGRTEAAAVLGAQMYDTVVREYGGNPADVVCCVPAGKSTIKKRGYNHAELLGQQVAALLKKPFAADVLLKVLDCPPQHSMGARDRWSNVLGAYGVENAQAVVGKTVLLVDDIMTTGATLNECAKALKEAGAREVFCVVCTVTRARTLVKAIKMSYNAKSPMGLVTKGIYSSQVGTAKPAGVKSMAQIGKGNHTEPLQ